MIRYQDSRHGDDICVSPVCNKPVRGGVCYSTKCKVKQKKTRETTLNLSSDGKPSAALSSEMLDVNEQFLRMKRAPLFRMPSKILLKFDVNSK